MQPSSDDVVQAGEEYTIRCTAPANGEVTATLGEKSYPLKQGGGGNPPGWKPTIPLRLPCRRREERWSRWKTFYQLTFDDKTTNATSQGSLYLVGKGRICWQRSAERRHPV